MRSVVITKAGPPDVLQVQERPDPVPGAGQLLIEVRAAGVNFADLMARVGLYPDSPDLPAVVGYEVAGTVAALGAGVEDYGVGDRVMAGTRFGGYSELAVANVTDVAPLPDSLSFEQGAAVPVNYLTAYLGLRRFGALEPGERVFLHSAAGGVGIAATQIAKHRGAEVWGSSSAGKHEAIRGFGVDHVIDYTQAGWQRDVPGIDVVMDALGGKSFRTSYDLLRAGGRLVCFGAAGVVSGEKRNLLAAGRTALRMPRFNLIKQMSASKTVVGLNMLTIWDELGSLEPFMAPIQAMLAEGALRPVVAESFAFADAPAAHRYIGERRNVGKVVLVP